MLPVRNFISLATTRRGSIPRSFFFARVMALVTMFPATDTAAAHAEDLCLEEWNFDFGHCTWTPIDATRRHSEHVEAGHDRYVALNRSAEAPVRSCMSRIPPR